MNRVLTFGSAALVWLAFTAIAHAQPANDECADAIEISAGSYPFSTVGATNSLPSESTCVLFNDIWYRFTASCSTDVTISFCAPVGGSATYDTKIAIYPDACPSASGTAIACNDDFCNLGSQVTFLATEGASYRIRLGAFSSIGFGTGTMAVSEAGLQFCSMTYQGRLSSAGTPVTGMIDLQYSLFDSLTGGTQHGPTRTMTDVAVTDGLFTAVLSASADELDGMRFLSVAVRSPAGSGSYSPLSPRQQVTAAPYAMRARISDSVASVPWSDLTDVPLGFADGIDNVGTGDITGVIAGAGLTGGGTSGSVTLDVSFGGNGVATTAARSDHAHAGAGDITDVVAGTGLTGGGASGSVTLDVSFAGNGSETTAARSDHAHSSLDASDGSPVDALSVDAGGAVGIGTTTPVARLHIANDSLWIAGTDGGGLGAAAGAGLRIFNGPTESNIFAYDYAAGAPRPLILQGAGSTVGIGTAAPASLLHLYSGSSGATPTPGTGLIIEDNASTYLSFLTPAGSNSGIAFGLPADANDGGFYYNISGSRSMQIRTGGNVTRMLIDSTGRVGIGRTPTANTLEVEGTASKTAAGSWLANSDRRIKRDVTTLSSALDTLDKLRLVSFRYTDEYRAAHPTLDDRAYLNVIAQEFAEVFPDWVKSSGENLPDGSEILQVDTYPITIYTAAAVQELNQKLRERDAEVAERDRRIAQLEERLALIEQTLSEPRKSTDVRR